MLQISNGNFGLSIRRLADLLEANPPPNYTTMYLNIERKSPSQFSLMRILADSTLIQMRVHCRPTLTDANMVERLHWCQDRLIEYQGLDINDEIGREVFARKLESCVDVDEMSLMYSCGTGRLYFLPGDLDGASAEEQEVICHEWKQSPYKILLFGAITAPRLLNPGKSHLEGAQFDDKKRGIIQIRRIRAMGLYKKRTQHHNKGDLKFTDCTVSGPVYENMMTGRNGLASFLDKYFDVREDDGVRTCAWGIPIELTTESRKPAIAV